MKPQDLQYTAGQETTLRTDERDLSLLRRFEELHVPAISDCLDQLSVRDNVLDPRIRPLFPARLAGYAAPVHAHQVDGPPGDPADYYKNELAAVDALQPGDVLVVSTCLLSFWGELLTTAALRRGARGIVGDTYTRDTDAIERIGFPTFIAGIQPQDSLGRVDVDAFGEPVECGGVVVHPGDVILADRDGVVVVPAHLALEVLERAEQKVAVEADMREELKQGLSVSDAFRRFGIL